LKRVLETAENSKEDVSKAVINLAVEMMNADIEINRKMAAVGQNIINNGDVILTHCNTGSLATVSVGTALGVIIEAFNRGKKIMVYATETRPLLQGARLTMFELIHEGVDSTLITDNAVAHAIKEKGITKVLVGADRILSDGTTFNKIGTLQLAILANHFKIPFYVVAPTSTIDMESSREDVIIEERDPNEIRKIGDTYISPKDAKVYNPAFDETPPELITGIITEKGIITPPYKYNIKKIM
jgi:methylthioribose-1-phosphate isomerase